MKNQPHSHNLEFWIDVISLGFMTALCVLLGYLSHGYAVNAIAMVF